MGVKKEDAVVATRPRTRAEKLKYLSTMKSRINRGAKSMVIADASEVPNTFGLRRPTGIMGLDAHLGGGFPAGGLSVISGPYHSGKSFLIYQCMMMHQKIYGADSILGLVSVEHNPDYWTMRKMGLKVAIPQEMVDERDEEKKSLGIPAFTKEERKAFREQIGTIHIIRGKTGEDIYDYLIDMVDSKCYGIIGLDSIQAMMSKAEEKTEEKGFAKNPQQASNASLLTRFLMHYYQRTLGLEGPNETTVLAVGQVRANRGKSAAKPHMAMHMKEWEFVAPHALKHAMLVNLTIWSGSKLREQKKKGEMDEESEARANVIGKVMNWRVDKGKAGTHDGLQGEVDFTYEQLYNDLHTVIMEAAAKGVIAESDGKITVFSPMGSAPATWRGEVLEGLPGQNHLRTMMEEDVDFEVFLRRLVLHASGISCHYKSD